MEKSLSVCLLTVLLSVFTFQHRALCEATNVYFSQASYTAVEGDILVITIETGAAVTADETVTVTTIDGTAAAADDYSSVVSNITISSGTSSYNISVNITDDAIGENTESFTIELSNPSLSLGTPNTTTVVISTDVMMGFNPTNYTVLEGETVDLTVELTGDMPADNVTVDFNIQDGTTFAGSGVLPLMDSTLTIISGSTSATITVTTVDDNIGQLLVENFTVQLSNPSLGVITESEASVQILADVITVEFSQTSYTVSEGDMITVTVVLIGDPPTSNVTVDVMTMNGTATDTMDFNALTDTITFTAGESNMKTITISTVDNSTAENSEYFTLVLMNPSPGVSLGTNSTASVQISADVSVGFDDTSYTVNEGETAMLTVMLSGDTPTSDVTVMVATVNGTAIGPGDFEPVMTTLTFSSGTTSQIVTISISDDTDGELTSENFTVVLSSPSTDVGNIMLSQEFVATVEISRDEIFVGFNATNYAVREGGMMVTLTLVLTGDTPINDVTVEVMTINGTAIATEDYTTLSMTVTFTAGETSKDVNVMILEDNVGEGAESFTVELSNPSSGLMLEVGSTVATVTILADEITVEFNTLSYTVNEGDMVELTLVLSGDAPTNDVTVEVMSVDGTAMAPSDYTSLMTTITFNNEETLKRISIQTINDILMETNESFTVSLGSIVSTDVMATLGTNSTVTVEIIDQDSGMLPEPVTNLAVEVFTTNNSVVLQWMDMENIFDQDLIYYIEVNVSARGVLLTNFSSSNMSADGSSTDFFFSLNDTVFIVSGVVVDVSVQASNNVGRGMSVEATDTAPGVFAPAVVGFQVTAVGNTSPPSVTLEWNNEFDEVPPAMFQLNYVINKLSVQPPQVSMVTLNLTQMDLSSSSEYDYEYTLSNLSFHTTYQFSLIAIYDTDESSTVTATHNTVEGTPTPAQDVMFTLDTSMGTFNSATNRYTLLVTITWNEPVEPNGVITMYEYTIYTATMSEMIANGTAAGNITTVQTTIIVEAFMDYTATIVASTTAGPSEPTSSDLVTTPQAAPSAPQNVVVGSITPNSAVVTWTMPEFSNGVIQQYTVQLVVDGSDDIVSNVTSQTSLMFMDLNPHTSYNGEVYAFTIERGLSSLFNFTTAQDEPGLVQDLTAMFVMDGSEMYSTTTGLYDINITISWTEPSDLNGELSHYRYRITSEQDGDTILAAVNTTEISVSPSVSVVPSTIYTVFVSAVTGGGEGTEASTTATSPEAAPTEVLNLAVVASMSTNTLQVSWDIPQRLNGMVSYILNLTYTDLATNEFFFVSSTVLTETSQTITLSDGLEPYVEYNVTVVAMTGAGQSNPVTESVITEEGVSTPPLSFTATPTNISVTLTWSPPADANGVIFEYIVQLDNLSPVPPNTLMLELDSLTPNTNYTVSVRANTGTNGNIMGNVATLNFVTMIGIPTEPQNVQVTPNDQTQSLLVSWSPPSTLNAPDVTYNIELTNVMTSGTVNQTRVTETNAMFNGLLPYTQYAARVQACSSAGCGDFSETVSQFTLEEAPSLPFDVIVTALSSSEISIEWTEPASPNGLIRYYLVTYHPTANSSDTRTENTINNDTSITISMLAPFTDYTITVVGVTVEQGDTSDPVTVVTDEDAPSQPRSVIATVLSSSEISIEWTEPESLNGLIRYYLVTYHPTADSSDTQTKNTTNDDTSIMITMLAPFTDYTISVVGVTVEQGDASDPVTVVTNEAAPSQPRDVSATVLSSNEISIEWNEPESRNGIIRNYLVTFYPTSNSSDTRTENTTNDDTTITISMLAPFTNYTITVVGVTVEEGNASDPVTAVTDEDAPSQPLDVSATALSYSEISIEWTEPESLNGIIHNYLVTYHLTSNSSDTQTENTTNDDTNITISMLAPFTNYTITVVGVTVEQGDASDPVTVVTNEAAPSAPLNTMAFNISSTSIFVQWDPPSSPNGMIINYLITYFPTGMDSEMMSITSNGNSVTLSGLMIYTNYSIFVQARTVELGEMSDTVEVTTDEDVPTPPTNVVAFEINSTAVMVTWSDPSSPNGILLYFNLTYINSNDSQDSRSLTFDADSSTDTYMAVLTGLDEFTEYQIMITVSTRIGISISKNVTVVTDPDSAGPPSFINAMAVSSTAIKVEWGFPSEPRGVIQGYNITYRVSSSSNEMVVNITLDTPNNMSNQSYVIDELAPFTNYYFKVSAYSFSDSDDTFQLHQGVNTEEIGPILTNEAAPSQPLNFQLESVLNEPTQLTATWTAPDTPNGQITAYTIYCNTSFSPIVVSDGDTFMETIDGLHPFTYYECYVTASTSAGEGNPSGSDTAQTVEAVPSEPVDFTVVVLSARTVSLTWSTPDTPNGIITGYMLTYSIVGDNTSPMTVDYTADEFNDTLYDLSPNKQYMFSLRASTGAGLGGESLVNEMTLEAAPDEPPQNVMGINTSSTSLFITWEEPPSESQNGDITLYIITYRIDGSNDTPLETNTSNTSIVLMNLMIFTYYEIRVSAVTVEEGPQSEVVVQTDSSSPSAPVSVMYTNISSSSVEITWSPPEMPNGDIAGYTLQYTPPDGEPPMNVTGITETMYNLTNLTPFTTYTVVIFALTDKGAGPASTELTVYTEEDTPDGPPQNFMTESINPQSVTLRWSEPVVPNGIIIHYDLMFTNETYTSDTLQINDVMSYVVEDLNEFTNYTFMVAAVTSAGTGPFGSLNVTTDAAAPSASPDSIEGFNTSSMSIFVRWNPPPLPDRNGVIDHYIIAYRVDGDLTDENTITTTTNTSIEITNLEIYTFYQVMVSAFTVAEGPSDFVRVRTDSSTPTAPRSVTVVNTTHTTITLLWQPPDPPNGEIEFYSIKYNSSMEDGTLKEITNIYNSPYTLTGLMEYVNYTIVVFAHTDQGIGNGSDSLVVETNEHLPDEPTNFNVEVINSTALTVTWEPPEDPNGVIISYHLYFDTDPRDGSYLSLRMRTSGCMKVGASERSYTLGGLHPFVEYQFQLAARTSEGVGNRTSNISATTLTAAPSEGVREMRVEVDGPKNVTVSWLPPEKENWNGQLTSYTISWRPLLACDDGIPNQFGVSNGSRTLRSFMNGNTPRNALMGSGELTRESVEINTLEEFISYEFTVTVETTEGSNPPELNVMDCVITEPAMPSRPPKNVSFTILSNTSALIEWIEPPLIHHNGIINYTVTLTNLTDSSVVNISTNELSMQIEDLIPFTEYSIVIRAVNQADAGPPSSPIERMTLQGLPEQPQSVKGTVVSPTQINLQWEPPNKFFGIVQPYLITYVGTKGDTKTLNSSATQILLDGLIGDSTYELYVSARSGAGVGESRKDTVKTPPGASPKVEVREDNMVIVPVVSTSADDSITQTSIHVQFSIIEEQQVNGDVEKYRIIVQKQPSSNTRIGTYYESSIATQDFVKYPALEMILSETNQRKKRATGEPLMQSVIVGGNDDCRREDEVCNGPLEPNSNYRIGYQLFSGGESTEYEFNKVFTTSARSNIPIVVGVIVVILVIFIAVVVVVIVIIVVLHKRKADKLEITKLSNGDQKLIPRDNGEKAGIPFLRPSDPGIVPIQEMKQQATTTTPGASNPRFVAPTHNNTKKIYLKDYSATVQDMLSDTGYKFSEEYERVTEVGLEHAKEDSLMAENRAKNRYTNILAYDHSRVKLSFVDDEPGSDYINASYIPGIRLRRAYIATQGPLPATFDDFWRMVWEQNTHIVVMLTQLVERGRTKCHRYWPGTEPSVYGDIAVEMISEKEKEDWTVREFKLSVADRKPRLVRHFQFTSWPDHGVPESPVAAIDFVNTVRTHVEVQHGPIVVHCSAGVGRTGCFIALDNLQQFVVDHDWVDIFGLACEMRQHRNHMIQTEAQYIFIHKALQEIIDSMTSYNSGPNFSQPGYTSLYINPFTEDTTQMSDYYGDYLSEETHM